MPVGLKFIFCQSVLEEVAFFSGNLRWLWLILANSLRIVCGLLREPDSLDRAIDIWDLGGVVRAIDSAAFLQGYADPFLRLVLYVKLLVGCYMYSNFINLPTLRAKTPPLIINNNEITPHSTLYWLFIRYSRLCINPKRISLSRIFLFFTCAYFYYSAHHSE